VVTQLLVFASSFIGMYVPQNPCAVLLVLAAYPILIDQGQFLVERQLVKWGRPKTNPTEYAKLEDRHFWCCAVKSSLLECSGSRSANYYITIS
jgi:hypothetical protein